MNNHAQVKKALAPCVMVLGLFFFVGEVKAATVYYQPVMQTYTNGNAFSSESFRQILGTSTVTGSVSEVTFAAQTNGGGTTNMTGSIACQNQPGLTVTFSGAVTGEASTTQSFTTSNYFYGAQCNDNVIVTINHNGGQTWKLGGAASDVVVGYCDPYTGGSCTPVSDLYLVLNGISTGDDEQINWTYPYDEAEIADFSFWDLFIRNSPASTAVKSLIVDYGETTNYGYRDSASTTQYGFVGFQFPKRHALATGTYYASAKWYVGNKLYDTENINFTISGTSTFASVFFPTASTTGADYDYYAGCYRTFPDGTLVGTVFPNIKLDLCLGFAYLTDLANRFTGKVKDMPQYLMSKPPFSLVTDGFVLFDELVGQGSAPSTTVEFLIDNRAYYSGTFSTSTRVPIINPTTIGSYAIVQTVRTAILWIYVLVTFVILIIGVIRIF